MRYREPYTKYSWLERGTVGVKCLVQEHNTEMTPARAQTYNTAQKQVTNLVLLLARCISFLVSRKTCLVSRENH